MTSFDLLLFLLKSVEPRLNESTAFQYVSAPYFRHEYQVLLHKPHVADVTTAVPPDSAFYVRFVLHPKQWKFDGRGTVWFAYLPENNTMYWCFGHD